jgi:Protein of unknown function (DUF2442)
MTTLQIEIEDSSPVAVLCTDNHLVVTLADGRIVQTPIWWYPRLQNASAEARNHIELMPMGVHWPDVDEDLSIAGMLRGQKAPGARQPAGA